MKSVNFQSEDGLKIEAEIFEGGDHWIIPAHGKAFNMDSWSDFAIYLNDNGFSVMPFNFRGYGNSQSKNTKYELDIIGALNYAKNYAQKISLIGASMGGAASLRALELYDGKINGLILLSPAGLPHDFSKLTMKAEKAIIFSTKGDFALESSETVAKNLPFLTEKIIFDGNSHAQVMLKDEKINVELKKRILEFLKTL